MAREHTLSHLFSYLIIALITGFIGFGVAMEGTAATIAKVLCLVFVTLFVVALLFQIGGRSQAVRIRNRVEHPVLPATESSERPVQEK
jgi:uncharacterized membrane protein YtjA (UPF0391 family)